MDTAEIVVDMEVQKRLFALLVARSGVCGPPVAALCTSGTISKEHRRNSLRILPILVLALIGPGVLIDCLLHPDDSYRDNRFP